MQEPRSTSRSAGTCCVLEAGWTTSCSRNRPRGRGLDRGVAYGDRHMPQAEGIVRKVYEAKTHRRLHCEEIECAGKGDKTLRFQG